MEREGKLFSNTVWLCGAAAFSRLIGFFLLPLCTAVLTPAEFGVSEVFISTAVLLIPAVSFHLPETVFRFTAGEERRENAFFTGGVLLACAFLAFALFLWLFPLRGVLSNYRALLYFYVLSSAFRAFFSHVLRAKGQGVLDALQQLFCALLLLFFEVVLLVFWEKGVSGYLLGIALADATTVLFLLVLRSPRFFFGGRWEKGLFSSMLGYALPLLFACAFWWVITSSNRYFLLSFCGETVTGVFAAASRLPALVTFALSLFLQAFQYAALQNTGGGQAFLFSRIYNLLLPALFFSVAGLMLLSPLIVNVLFSAAYREAVKLVPLLLLGALALSLSSFLGSAYSILWRPFSSLFTTFAAASLQTLLNVLLIRGKGAMGAALAFLFSSAFLFFLRLFHVARLLSFETHWLPVAASFSFLFVAVLFWWYSHPYWFFFFLAVALLFHLRSGKAALVFLYKRSKILLTGQKIFKKYPKKAKKDLQK